MSVTSNDRPLLEIERFSARFGDKLAVRDLNLSIACGGGRHRLRQL